MTWRPSGGLPIPAMCRLCRRGPAAAPSPPAPRLARISNRSKCRLLCDPLKVGRKSIGASRIVTPLPPSVAATDGVQMLHLMLRAAGELASAVTADFVGTKARARRPPTALAGRPKAGHPRRRRSREFWNADSALGNLGPAICVRNTDAGWAYHLRLNEDGGRASAISANAEIRATGTAPATGEMRPDLDASAILSRAASTGPRWLIL